MRKTTQPSGREQGSQPVIIYIEELVLHGFDPAHRHRIAAAVERELARLVIEGGLSGLRANPITLGRIRGGTFKVAVGEQYPAAGRDIARAVFRSLQQHVRASANGPGTRQARGGRLAGARA